MIRLCYSNRTEALLEALLERLAARRAAGADPLEPTRIVVPNKNVERFVELGLARGLGIAANITWMRLPDLLGLLETPQCKLLIGTPLRAGVIAALLDDALVSGPAMDPVRRYLRGAGAARTAVELRRAQLALRAGEIFEEYAYSRPELLDAWSQSKLVFQGTVHGATERWQAALFGAIRAPGVRTIGEALADPPPVPGRSLIVFGLSYVARVFSRVFAHLGERLELDLYTLNPCEEFWEDLETLGELRRRRRMGDTEPMWVLTREDPFDLGVDTEQVFLRSWGRPGREHVRLLGALTDCDFEPRFVDPIAATAEGAGGGMPLFARVSQPTLLERLQHDVLHRAPSRAAPDRDAAADESLRVLACPSVRREVEAVAAEIWSLARSQSDLRFNEIAVLVNGPDRDLYLPHLTAVFEEAHHIPYNLADLSLASSSPIVEGALRLLALPTTRLTRPDVLAVVTHPCVRPIDIDPQDWVTLADELGIFHGLDREAHAGTYVEGDLLSWEQGLLRIAIGALMSGAEVYELDGRRYVPHTAPPGERSAGLFLLLVRSLLSDVRFAERADLTLAEWARFASALLSTYLVPSSEREEGDLRRALASVELIGALDCERADRAPARVGYVLAHELLRAALEGLGASRGQQLADGVAIASLLPMRAIPFRAVFVLGLGEGRFPAADRRDSMDLRAARRQVGDVTPPERDRYTFLETLLCARERLTLSYVARDEQTGDPLAPSTVVQELLDAIEQGYLEHARARLIHRVPLRRHDDPRLVEVLPEAAAEARARDLGQALRAARATAGLSSVAAARAVAGEPPLLDALALAPLPAPRSAERTEPIVRVSISALRKLLECPLQAWAQYTLRIDEIDDASPAAIADEPLRPEPLDATVTLRDAIAQHVLAEQPLAAAYRARVERLQAHGRWPIGALARLVEGEHTEILSSWKQSLLSMRPTTLERVRLGSAEHPSEAPGERVLDPLVLRFDDDPRSRGSGRPLTVEIVGRTELLAHPLRSSLTLLPRKPRGARGDVARTRHALRGFFDHAVLSALGQPADEHRSAQLYADDPRPGLVRFSPIDPADARGWLSDLVRDLIAERHAYLLPCEAVLRLGPRALTSSGDALVASVAFVRDRWGGGQSAYGPVRDALVHPPPAPGLAEELVDRRFGAFLRRVRPG